MFSTFHFLYLSHKATLFNPIVSNMNASSKSMTYRKSVKSSVIINCLLVYFFKNRFLTQQLQKICLVPRSQHTMYISRVGTTGITELTIELICLPVCYKKTTLWRVLFSQDVTLYKYNTLTWYLLCFIKKKPVSIFNICNLPRWSIKKSYFPLQANLISHQNYTNLRQLGNF